MSEASLTRVGGVLSADIAVPDHDREVRFYSRVLTTGERPLWREDLMNNLGIPVIGLGERSADYAALPVQWMPHMQVADVAASVQTAIDTGGKELMHARDDNGESQWAVLLDPNGAAFGIIPVVSSDAIPSEYRDTEEPVGRIAWLDLTVNRASATRDFYRSVVGWSVENVEMKNADEQYADFNMVGEDGRPAAGICHARGVNSDLPPVWLIYLPVGDIQESLGRVEAEGGAIVRAVRKENGEIAYAIVRDPVGAYFAMAPA